MVETTDNETSQTVPREIVITNQALEFGNIEAWTSVIASYNQKHPDHEVVIIYEGQRVNSMIALYKKIEKLNRNGFEMVVAAPDENWSDVPKLYRYLVEGAGPNYRKFIEKELHTVLKLF